jgi:hypothetical protein
VVARLLQSAEADGEAAAEGNTLERLSLHFSLRDTLALFIIHCIHQRQRGGRPEQLKPTLAKRLSVSAVALTKDQDDMGIMYGSQIFRSA